MLTLEIKDVRLEQKITEKAQKIGKTVQELLQSFIEEKIQEDDKPEKLPFEFEKLDYRKYVHVYNPDLSEEELLAADDETVQPFSHVTDTVEYARTLRKNAWTQK